MQTELTTKQKVKDFLGITSADYDTQITELVLNTSSQIEAYCGRLFNSTSYTEYFDVENGDTKLFISNYPVSSLSSVQYRTGTWGAITWDNFNSNDYLLDEDTGKVSFALRFNGAEKYIKIVYVGGFLIDFNNENNSSLHTLPRDLMQTATEMTAKVYQLRTVTGIASESTEGQSITYTKSLPEEADRRLDRYRNINF